MSGCVDIAITGSQIFRIYLSNIGIVYPDKWWMSDQDIAENGPKKGDNEREIDAGFYAKHHFTLWMLSVGETLSDTIFQNERFSVFKCCRDFACQVSVCLLRAIFTMSTKCLDRVNFLVARVQLLPYGG